MCARSTPARGFGVRGEFYPEDYLVPAGWPRRWPPGQVGRGPGRAPGRGETRVSRCTGLGGVRRGRPDLALADDILHDNRAYCRMHGPRAELTVAMLPARPGAVFRGRIRVLLTNKTLRAAPTVRRAGSRATTAREQLLDMAADQLGIGRADLRRRNLLGRRELPCAGRDHAGHRRGAGHRGLPGAAGRGRGRGRAAGVSTRSWRTGARRGGAGLGLAVSWRRAASAAGDRGRAVSEDRHRARVLGRVRWAGHRDRARPDRRDALGVGLDAAHAARGTAPCSGSGPAPGVAVHGGGLDAVHAAATAVAAGPGAAARTLEAAEDDLVAAARTIMVRGDRGRRVTSRRSPGPRPRPAVPGAWGSAGLAARRRFDVTRHDVSYGVHIAVAEVDPVPARSGCCATVAYEVGRRSTPRWSKDSCAAASAGHRRSAAEEFSYDEAGQPQAVTFMDVTGLPPPPNR